MGMTSKFGAYYASVYDPPREIVGEYTRPIYVDIINKCSTKIGDITVQNYFPDLYRDKFTVKRLGNIRFGITSKNVKINKAGTARPAVSGIIGSGTIRDNDKIEITDIEGPNKNQYNFYYNVIRKGKYVIMKAPLKKSI
jgi:hypothetical protein